MTWFVDEDVEVILKVLRDDEDEYDRRFCAVSGCSSPSSVLDDTRRLVPHAVPLCEEHWEDWCEWAEAEDAVLGSLTAHPAAWS